MEHYQKAIDRAKARLAPTASLSVSTDLADTIILDSGASGHFLKHRAYFHHLTDSLSSVFGANGAAIPILGFGPATIHTMAGPVQLSLAYYLPQLSNSLISLTHYICLGFVVFQATGIDCFECKRGAEVIFTGSTQENVLLINTNPLQVLSIKLPDPIDIHWALGHPSLPYLKNAFPNIRVAELACEDCNRAKMHKQSFGGNFPTFKNPLDCIHMDLCGPITPVSRGGNLYFLKIINGFTKYQFIYPMRCKSATFNLFTSFLCQAETFTGRKLKPVVSDNGGKFCNKRFASLFDERGIQHLTLAPYTPKQNPLGERGNWSSIEKACALLSTSGLPLQWWGEAVQLSIFLENRSPDSSIGFALPYEKWHGHLPDLSCLVPFGCRAVVLQEKKKRGSKLAPSGVEAIFINYNGHHHSYKLWVPKTNKLVISHHVRFFPQTFPRKIASDPLPAPPVLFDFMALDNTLPEPVTPVTPRSPTPPLDLVGSQPACPIPSPSIPDNSLTPPPSDKKGYAYVPHFDKAPQDISSAVDESNIIKGPRRRHRALVIVREPSSLKDPTLHLLLSIPLGYLVTMGFF
jgi:transposase InsO family protein